MPLSTRRASGIKCVYVAVGQKASSIAAVVRKLEEHGAMEHTIVVAATAADPAADAVLGAILPAVPWVSITVIVVKMR